MWPARGVWTDWVSPADLLAARPEAPAAIVGQIQIPAFSRGSRGASSPPGADSQAGLTAGGIVVDRMSRSIGQAAGWPSNPRGAGFETGLPVRRSTVCTRDRTAIKRVNRLHSAPVSHGSLILTG